MKEENATLQEQESQDSPQKKPMSALDAINASFAAQKEEMGEKNRSAKRVQERAKKGTNSKAGKKEDLKWNLITAFLVLIIVVVAVVIVVTLYMGSRAENPSAVAPDQTQEHTISEDGRGTEESQLQDQEDTTQQQSDSEENRESQTSQSDSSESGQEQSGQSESGETQEESEEGTAQSETQGVVPEEYVSILTQEEQQEWREKEKDPSRVFIQLNQKVEITDMQNVYLRLINPPYSAFTIQVRVYTDDHPDQTLYESDRVAPGTVLEYVPFSGELEAGSHPAKVEYTVYDEDGNELGIHEVDITLEVGA